jgi:hypothetical protein
MKLPHRLVPIAAFGIACLIAASQPGTARAAVLMVGPDKTFANPSAAAAAAHDGDHVIIAAGTYFDCAVWRANDLTIEGAGPDATIITDKACNGKGLFIMQGNRITVSNLTLTRARVPDFNGAGIRAEGGDLTVDHVNFVNNQNGIMGGNLPGRSIVIRDSAFLKNGTCEGNGGCAHGIYVGVITLLRIERTRLIGTRQGHAIKSRALRTEVIGCDIADGPDGTSSYSVEIPNGGGLLLRDTKIEKGPKSENHTAAVMIGAEGVTQPTPEITVEHNTFVVDGDYTSFLVDNITATEAELKGNILKGGARALHGDGAVK